MSKALPFLLLNLFFIQAAIAQNSGIDPKKDTVLYYLKNSGEMVTNKDSANYYRFFLPPDSSDLKLYNVREYYKDMKPKLTGKSSVFGVFPVYEGTRLEYFPDGKRKNIKNFANGVELGDETIYYPNGKFYTNKTYDKDHKIILNECRDSTGKVLAENGNGIWVDYAKDLIHVIGTGPVVSGLREGQWQGSISDSVKYFFSFSKGVAVTGISYQPAGKEYPLTELDAVPQFKGGAEGFYRFLGRTIIYPAKAKDNNTQGRVIVTFVVEKDGSISGAKIVHGIGDGCDEEVLRVMYLSPKWLPGTLYGVLVRVQYSVPISFAIDRN